MESAFKNVSKFGFVTPDKILKGKKKCFIPIYLSETNVDLE